MINSGPSFGSPTNGVIAMTARIAKFLSDESGVSALEYGLIAAFVSIAAIGVLSAMGQSLEGMLTTVTTSVTSTMPGG